MDPQEQFADLPFPEQGIDLSTEYELQRDGTTPAAQNARTFEGLTRRGRGGSRAGLAQYIPATVNGASVIQHLNFVVDPSEDALLTGFDGLDGVPAQILLGFPSFGLAPPTVIQPPTPPGLDGFGGVPDPSTNNLTVRNPGYPSNPRYVSSGGNGFGLNRNVAKHRTPTQAIAFVQQNEDRSSNSGVSVNTAVPFLANVTAGGLIVVAVGASRYRGGFGAAPANTTTLTLSDSQGNVYAQLGSTLREYTSLNPSPDAQSQAAVLALYAAVASASGALTVTATAATADNAVPADAVSVACLVHEFSGAAGSTPDGTDGAPATGLSMTTGTVAVAGDGRMIFGVFFGAGLTYTAGTGFTLGQQILAVNNGKFVSEWILDQDASLPATMTQANASGYDNNYLALGASFAPA